MKKERIMSKLFQSASTEHYLLKERPEGKGTKRLEWRLTMIDRIEMKEIKRNIPLRKENSIR